MTDNVAKRPKTNRVGTAVAGLLIAACAGQLPFGQAVAAEGEQAETGGMPVLEQVYVTARRRSEDLQDVPMSVSALTGDQLAAIGARNNRDIGAVFPGVSFNDSNGSGGEFSIRGLTSAGSGSDTSVGLYVDEVFVGDEASMSQRLFDLESFQVLRGPQGTLFGRNTVAGAINVVTLKPQPEFDANVDLSVGNYNLVQYGGMLNLPLVGDRLMARASFVKRERDGYLKNLADPGNAGNDENGYNMRLHVLARPTDATNVLLSGDYSKDDTCDNMFKLIDGVLYDGNDDPDSSAWDGPCTSTRRVNGVSLRVDQELGHNVLTLIAAHRQRDTQFLTDRDFTAIPLLITGLNSDEEQTTLELRLAGPTDGRLRWVVGAFYFDRSYFQDTVLELGPAFLGPGLSNTVNSLADLSTESYAGFASLEYAVSDALDVEVGLRYTSEDKSLDYEQTATLPIPGFGVVAPFSKTVDGSEWSPTLTATYRLTPEHSVYARYARGFKSAGFNAGPSSDPDRIEFAPEFLDNYEIGYKALLMDGALRFDGSAFYLDYQDIQQSSQDGAGFYISNAAEARSYGVEAQVAAQFTDSVVLNAGVGYVDAEYTSFGDKTGNALPRAPKLTASIAAQLSWPAPGAGHWTAVPEVTYRSENYVDSGNTELFKQDAHTLVNLRMGYQADAGWEVTAWVRNATDERVNLGGFAVAPLLYAVTLSPPRTYGLDVRWTF